MARFQPIASSSRSLFANIPNRDGGGYIIYSQQERMTSTEREIWDKVRSLNRPEGAPEIRLYISREKEIVPQKFRDP